MRQASGVGKLTGRMRMPTLTIMWSLQCARQMRPGKGSSLISRPALPGIRPTRIRSRSKQSSWHRRLLTRRLACDLMVACTQCEGSGAISPNFKKISKDQPVRPCCLGEACRGCAFFETQCRRGPPLTRRSQMNLQIIYHLALEAAFNPNPWWGQR